MYRLIREVHMHGGQTFVTLLPGDYATPEAASESAVIAAKGGPALVYIVHAVGMADRNGLVETSSEDQQ